MALRARWRRFVDAYVLEFNATSAAIAAGYSRRTARQQGSRLLTNVDIAAAIAEAVAQQRASAAANLARRPMTLDDVRAELEKIARADIRQAVRWRSQVLTTVEDPDTGELELVHTNDVELVNSSDLPDDVAAAIGEVSQTKNGSLKIKLLDKRGALVALERSLSRGQTPAGAGKQTPAQPPAGQPLSPNETGWAELLEGRKPN